MTIADSSNPALLVKPTLPVGPTVEVRWVRIQPRILCGGADHAAVPCRSELVLAVQCMENARGRLEMWVDTPTGRQVIRKAHPVQVVVHEGASLTHIDVDDDDQRLLSLTIAADGRTVYAQSCLLADAGFEPGTYDRPHVQYCTIQTHVASA
jgi:hypothetical protein